ncbi:hypothetical protein F5Y14DRAFT_211653 [Nemania sp. NC0429]|nr:hypothetical protein F5Y14DRAFT_211653 [Nemania sp. NC0429]
MSMSTPVLRSLFARLSLTHAMCRSALPSILSSTTPFCPSRAPLSTRATTARTTPSSPTQPRHHQQSRSIHTTTTMQAKGKGGKSSKKKGRKGKGKGMAPDPRIKNLKASTSRAVPSPLRFARNRALRHWTIHRAWLLYQRKERERQAHELERMYQSMHNACEELRNTSGPGTREEGYLYRMAMLKHGMYGHNAMPIEYARPQTETPARQAWNHEWTR